MKRSLLFIAIVICLSLVFGACNSNTPAPAPAPAPAPTQGETPAPATEPSDTLNITKKNLSLATANSTGTFYVLGAGMAQLLNSHASEYINITAESTAGSVENVKLLSNNDADFAIISGDVTYQGYYGTETFDRPYKLLGLMRLHNSFTHIAVLENSPITTVQDLVGKKVVTGESGSGNEVKNKAILAELGLIYNENYTPLFLSYNEGCDALRDGQADAVVLTQGYPIPALMDLAATKKIRLISFTDEELDTITNNLPYFYRNVIPAGTYEGVDYDTQTFSTAMELAASADLEEDAAYLIVKTLADNWEEMYAVHSSAYEVVLEDSALVAIPLHPGAERYYKEMGYL